MSVQMPGYVTAINRASAVLYSITEKGGILIAAGAGAALGKREGKTATYALQFVLTDIFWRYVQPRTFQKLFMHLESKPEARFFGSSLSFTAACVIPHLLTQYVISHIHKDTPYIGQLKRESETTISELFEAEVFLGIIVLNGYVARGCFKAL